MCVKIKLDYMSKAQGTDAAAVFQWRGSCGQGVAPSARRENGSSGSRVEPSKQASDSGFYFVGRETFPKLTPWGLLTVLMSILPSPTPQVRGSALLCRTGLSVVSAALAQPGGSEDRTGA